MIPSPRNPTSRPALALGLTAGVFLIALVLGWFPRFSNLGTRPMHTDEAVHGLKLGAMLREGYFEYDPSDYHGPTLHQSTALAGGVFGWHQYDAASLRLIPAAFGWACLLVFLCFRRSMGFLAVAIAALLGAYSPMLVYYSRYYIMETLLALQLLIFLAFLQSAARRVRLWNVVGMGIAAGLMHATKETFVLYVGPILFAAWVCGVFSRDAEPSEVASDSSEALAEGRDRRRFVRFPGPRGWWLIAAGVLACAVVSALFITSFGRHPQDWLESYTTYFLYLRRAGEPGFEQPWHYYLSLLLWRKEGLIWTEALPGVLGLIGMAGAWRRGGGSARVFTRALSLGLLLSFAVFSVISYKTPWSILPFWTAWLLLAGSGAAMLWAVSRSWIWRGICFAGLAAWLVFSHGRNELLNGRYASGPNNPYAFSHTSPDAVRLALRILRSAEATGFDQFSVKIFHREFGLPLGWYLRDLPQAGVWAAASAVSPEADVVVVDWNEGDSMAAALGEGYRREMFGLRPGKNLAVFINARIDEAWKASARAPTAARTY